LELAAEPNLPRIEFQFSFLQMKQLRFVLPNRRLFPAIISLRSCRTILISLISITAVHGNTPTPTPTPTNRTVKFAWQASSSSEVVGYKIFWGTGSHNYQSVRDVKNVLTTSVSLSTSTKYYVAVVAYSMTNTSGFSNEVVVPASR
jgi:hypothetical protein